MGEFNFRQINTPPEESGQYVLVKQIEGDKGLEFAKELAARLRARTPRVMTDPIHEDLVIIGLIASGVRSDYTGARYTPNSRDGKPRHGVFFFERRDGQNRDQRRTLRSLLAGFPWIGKFFSGPPN